MAIESDVLVVGGGLAGSVAALAAAESGASVRMVTKAESTLAQASGLIDVLGYLPESEPSDEPVAHPFEAVDQLPGDHPYSILGVDAIREGLELFHETVEDAYLGDYDDRNALVPTPVGTVKPTARYPRSVAPGLASRQEATLLVGFEGIPGFDAPLVATRLESNGVPFDVEGVTVEFPGEFPEDASKLRLAMALDRDDPVDVAAGPTTETTTRAALAERIRPHLDGHERVGVPALLGRDHGEEVRKTLSESLDAAVFEVPTAPPSVLGLRLADLLEDALMDAGVHRSTGQPVVDFEADGDRITEVLVDREGQPIPYGAEAFVLATGGLVGKGIASSRERVAEPVFDCYVPHPGDRYDWFEDDAFDDHPFARFGVVIDDRARPLDADGDPKFENLRAAGGVVGGADVAREKSASGVSLASGTVAGRDATDEVI